MRKLMSWMTVVYVVNWLIVCLCCWGTYFSVAMFDEIYSDLFEGQPIPSLTLLLVYNLWILWLIPLLWGIVTIAVAVSKHSTMKAVLHALASIFLGLLIFCAYMASALMPFLRITWSLGN